VVSSERIAVGLVEVETLWSLDDIWAANAVLDALEQAEALASESAR
jgi:hypothetical protein